MTAFSLLLLAALQQPAPAAPARLPTGSADTSPFRRLAWPTPTLLREGSGAPGPRYWQQRADYVIRAALDTAAHTITGRETIRYTNNSPDTLRYLWLQVDQNIYRTDSRGAAINPTDARFAGAGFVGGYTIESFGEVLAGPRTARGPTTRVAPLHTTVNSTMLRAELDRPLAPGRTITLDLAYHFQVPEHGSDRMGRKQYPGGWLYEIAQWYPRMAVYDDVRGWNTEQYLGQGEFYLEYGDFDVALTATQRERLARAIRSDSGVAIITRTEAGTPATRPAGAAPTFTWRFAAKNVRDVAWAAAPNFIWDASGWNGILMQAYYAPEANPDWSQTIGMVRHSIKHYSEKWFPYPYPTAINIAGPVGGMEYPMIVFCGDRAGGRGLFGVTTHELGHEWFPMTVGSNERLYAWMDEGFNTFINIYSTRAFYRDTTSGRGFIDGWGQYAASGQDIPPMLAADRVPGDLLGNAEYSKPAVGLFVLRQHVLDDTTRCDAAFREYVRRWACKHPTPADFFRSMEDALGEDLSWFWRGWFYRTDVVDLAVDSVRTRTDSSGTTSAIFI